MTCVKIVPIFSPMTKIFLHARLKDVTHYNTKGQYKQNHKIYFATLSVEQQLIEIMSRPEMWEKMESYMCKTQQNNSVITDIHAGEAYKHVIISNNDAMHTFTLSMNTDGALLYNSSHVDLWPVFLVINE